MIAEKTRTPLTIGNQLAAGGEGRICVVANQQQLVAKLYQQPTIERSEKLQAMIGRPPQGAQPSTGHTPIAWPLDRILNEHNQCIGFLMPRLNAQDNIALLKLYNPQDRWQVAPSFTWQYLLRAATNLALVVHNLHEARYVIGDLNESNIFVTTKALVTLVDCDSMQVTSNSGQILRCTVGKADYTPPELQGRDFSKVDRASYHDTFGLAVLVFMMLMEGVHPFDGVWRGSGTDPTREQRIKTGDWPYAPQARVIPPPMAVPYAILPPGIQTLMQRCFVGGQQDPTKRPSAQDWYAALSAAEKQLKQCRVNPLHWYGNHLQTCPWCARITRGVPDSFPQPGQQKLPALPAFNPSLISGGSPKLVVSQQPLYPLPSHRSTSSFTRSSSVGGWLVGTVVVVIIAAFLLGNAFKGGSSVNNSTPGGSSTPEGSSPTTSLLYQANWSNGLDGWFADVASNTSFSILGNKLHNDGSNCCLLLAPMIIPSENYSIEAQIQWNSCPKAGSFGIFGRGLPANTSDGGFKGYVAYWGTSGNFKLRSATDHNSDTWPDLIQQTPYAMDQDVHTFRMRFLGNNIQFYFDDRLLFDASNSNFPSGGYVGIEDLSCSIDVISFKILNE